MKINRRRFLTISAAMTATPALAGHYMWQGRALGADVSLTIRGRQDVAEQALRDTRVALTEIERLFSLYDTASDLVQLNNAGALEAPDERFLDLIRIADRGHKITDGLFDPTVQALWRALAQGHDSTDARAAVGWDRVRFDPARIVLGGGQALTFNGIAQGFATDVITAYFVDFGLTETLVNIGEYRALGGPWRLAINDPKHGTLGARTLQGHAIATSSPDALLLGAVAHILHPSAVPQWSTVSVEADTAALADCLSTGLCMATLDQIERARSTPEVRRITLVDFEGNLRSL